VNLKNNLITLLKEKKYNRIKYLSASRKRIITVLISLTYDRGNSIAWRAMEAIGLFTSGFAESDPETVRHTVERLLWMIRDESGGIGWSVPEILGEIVRNNPELCSDIGPIIVSFHEEQPLRAGVIRAAGRIGRRNMEMVDYAIPVILAYLKSSDSSVRGYAVWALSEMTAIETVAEIEKLKDDNNCFVFYEDGELKEKTVGELAVRAVAKLKS
jgi:hypothetical protein